MIKKKYNPFKLFGSYLGAVIFGIMGFGAYSFCNLSGSCTLAGTLSFSIGGAILGFLIGWGIHSLARYLWSKFR